MQKKYKKTAVPENVLLGRTEYIELVKEEVRNLFIEKGYTLATNRDIEIFQDYLWKKDIFLSFTEVKTIIQETK